MIPSICPISFLKKGILYSCILLSLPSCQTSDNIAYEGEDYFVKLYGGAGNQFASEVLETTSGNYLLVGSSNSQNGGSHMDFFLIMVDPAGNELWSSAYDFEGFDDEGLDVVEDDNGFLVTGTVEINGQGQTKAGFLKVDNSGQEIWKTTIGRTAKSSETGRGIILLGDGSVIIAGETTDIDKFKYGQNGPSQDQEEVDTRDFYWIKLSLNQDTYTISWQKALGSRGDDQVMDLLQTSTGGVRSISLLGQKESSPGSENKDLYLFTVNENGNQTAVYESSLPQDVTAVEVAEDQNRGFVFMGNYREGSINKILVQPLNEFLQKSSDHFIIEEGSLLGTSIQSLGSEGYIISGTMEGESKDVQLIKLDRSGSTLISRSYGDAEEDEGGGILPLDDGFLLNGTISFGTNTMITLIKTNSEGELAP